MRAVLFREGARGAALAVLVGTFLGCSSKSGSAATDPLETSGSGGSTVVPIETGGTGGGASAPCTPNTTAPCDCPSPATGEHLCGPDGQFGACACRWPAGSLVCGGVACKGGGACDPGGGCPAFLDDCFAGSANVADCDVACRAHGYTCVQSGCAPDGSGFAGGFTWVSYSGSDPSACASFGDYDKVSMDECVTPIGLSQQISSDAVIRCCCHA